MISIKTPFKILLTFLILPIGVFIGTQVAAAVNFGSGAVRDTVFSGSGAAQLDLDSSDFEQTITCPDVDAYHSHGYENTTHPDEGYESYMIVHKMRIYLHDDFMTNIDLSNIECSTPSSWVSCDGGHSSDYGGVDIALVQNDTSADAIYPDYVEWTYGSSDSTEKPMGPGYNDYDEDGSVDTTTDDRDMAESVYFEFNGEDTSASATTTSALYVQFWQYDQSCGNFSSSSCWSEVEEDGSSSKHWNTHTYTAETHYECASLTCASLSISPTTEDLSVSDVFSDVPFSVSATASDGSDITADSTFQYYINKYGSSTTAGDADGNLKYGFMDLFRSKSPNTTDSAVTFEDTEPGDSLYVYVSDYNGSAYIACNAEIVLPYCTDLNITDPAGSVMLYSSTSFSTNITVEASSENSETGDTEDWPYSITYDSTDDAATYDGNSDSYTTDDYTVDDYESSGSATLNVNLDDENGDGESDDVAGLCFDSFDYNYYPSRSTCRDLTITTTGPISAEDMEAGNVEISWTSTMIDGTVTPPPYTCISSNASGTFVDSTGMPGTGSITTSMTTVYYTGAAGDTVTCFSSLYPACVDTLTSETASEDVYACHDVDLGEPYIVNDDGTHTTLDLSDSADVSTLYDNTTVCYDYTLLADAGLSDTLVAASYEDSTKAAYAGNLSLTVNETGGSDVNNPATVAVTGYSTYTGTVCWQNYEPGNYLSLNVVGSPLNCYDDTTLPTPEVSPYACTDLEMTPDSVVIPATDSTAQTLEIKVEVTASDAAWGGTLMVTKTGSGTLYYADDTLSAFGDGHLEFPLSGTDNFIALKYIGGVAGDVVTAYIQSEEGACTDNFSITQGTNGGSSGGGSGSSGSGSGSSGSGTSSSSGGTCNDVSFNESDTAVLSCADYENTVCVDTDNGSEDVTITGEGQVCYKDEDDEWQCDEDSITASDIENGDCIDVKVEDVCSDQTVTVSAGESCEDSIDLEVAEIGTFQKSIYTFNFSSEKNPYTDEGIFFSHDDDRAFYTLEYDPTGDEGQIVFTDDMWDNLTLNATNGDGGTVELVTSWTQLVNGASYTTVENLGFGDIHEENSDSLLAFIDANYSSSKFMSYVPYIKMDGMDSVQIDPCEYDETSKALNTTTVCYDYRVTPDADGQVIIENAGNAVDQYGEGAAIRIRYVGIVNSKLDCSSSEDCLTEEYTNNANVDAYPELSDSTLSASARLVVLCSYLLTENAGDVYLDENFEGGSNLACIYEDADNSAGYSNTDGLVIVNSDTTTSDGTVSATTDSSVTDETASYCDSNDGTSLLGNLSSYVCEIFTSVSNLWKESSVESTTDEHLSQATRNVSTNQVSDQYSSWNDLLALSNTNNPDSHILYFDGSKSTTGTLELTGEITVPAGAWTLIVENADLQINKDITYATVDSSDYNDLPSMAFVVTGGDIFIENTASNLVGVYYTDQSFDGTDRSAVYGQLFVDGSLYGNLQPLLDACNYVGPPTQEGGGLVVRYDSRILLNTPPSLSEYVDVDTEKSTN